MLLGGASPVTYYGAVRAQIMEPETFTTQAAFLAAIPSSATASGTAAEATSTWTAIGANAAPTGTWADTTTNINTITKSVNNGDSFVIALDHDVTVTWISTAVPTGMALVRREQLDTGCATFAL
jgi:glycosidase